MKKRVYCLYRVSTKGQVEKDDIPMQKQVRREFARERDWEIVREFSEKGVSGFKVSAKNRDAIQEIQTDAALGKFDVLLVFMFDRLGRREDETPFVVEWFVRNGVEVWSTVEGQQRFDSHVDKLMNYIRFWQASGESLKTSIRVKTRLGQLVQEGKFRGGVASYGYQLVKKGRLGRKNQELSDLEVNPQEAVVVRMIFDLAERFGYGGRRISTELAAKNVINLRTNEPFHYATIQSILKNVTYTGVLRSGETRSEVFPELQIISQEQFERVQNGIEQRSMAYRAKCRRALEEKGLLSDGKVVLPEDFPTFPVRVTGRALLSGNVFCGHCGGRIVATTGRKSHHKDPRKDTVRIPIYKCYNRTQHKGVCEGPTSYRAEKIDGVIEGILRSIFDRAKSVCEHDFIQHQVEISLEQYRQQLQQTKTAHTKYQKELVKWESLMMDSMESGCAFTPEQVRRRMDDVQERLGTLNAEIVDLENRVLESREMAEEVRAQYQRLLSWGELFANASIDEKKVVTANLIKAVTITRNYGIQVEFRISEAQYLSGLEMG